MKRFLRSHFLYSVIGILSVVSPLHSEPLDQAYEKLFANQTRDAASLFQQSATENPEAAAGVLLSAWAAGDHEELALRLMEALRHHPDSPYTGAFLAFLGSPELQGYPVKARVSVLRDILSHPDLSPLNRQLLQAKLAESLDMLLDPAVESAARQAGTLIDHWSVIGPFGRFGGSDFYHPFPPEQELCSSCQGWQKTVTLTPVSQPDRTGMLEFDSLVSSIHAVAYAFNVIEATAPGEAFLTIQSPANVRIWWNGQPVMEKFHQKLHTSQAMTVRVSLRQGKNLLAVKTQKYDHWWLRARLQSTPENAVQFHSVPFKVEEFAHLQLRPFSDEKYLQIVCSEQPSSYPFSLPDDNGRNAEIINHILLAVWHSDRSEFDTARNLLKEVMALEPDFALPYSIYGDLSLRLAMSRSGSKARFQQEAEVAYRKALELHPYSPNPLIGLQTYFMERNQVDAAIDLIDQHLAAYPELTYDASAALDYAYGLLYQRKGFSIEAVQKIQRAAQGYLPSYELFRHLFNHYENNQHFTEAAEILARALDYFPAYHSFLEMALRMNPEVQANCQLQTYLERALQIHPAALRYMTIYGDYLESQNRLEEALTFYQQQMERFPDVTSFQSKQAQLAFRLEQTDKALKLYQAVYQKRPNNQEAFHALRNIQQKVFPYQKYDTRLEEISTDIVDKWKNSRASMIYLLDIMVQDIHEDGTYDQYIHQAIQVLNQEGLQNVAETVIPRGSHVELILARTINPDGTEWAIANLQDLNNQQALSMYGVEIGSIVEYAYLEKNGTRDPGSNFALGAYFFGAENDPMLLSTLTVLVPESMTLEFDTNPASFSPKITRQEGKTVYHWRNFDQDGIKAEAFAPPLAMRVPSVRWTSNPDWMLFIERFRLSRWGYEEASPLIDALYTKLREQSDSKEAFARNVYHWIQQNIEDSSGGQTTADTVALGAGGQYQKIRLAHQLLEMHGINTRIAAVLDVDYQDKLPPLPNLGFSASAVILILPQQEGISDRILLDFRSRFAPFASIPPEMHKQVALVVDETAPSIEPINPDFWEHGLLLRSLSLKDIQENHASIEGNYTYLDSYDEQLREALRDPETRRRIADMQLSRDLRGIQLQTHELKNVEDLSRSPSLVFTGTMPGILKSGGQNSARINPVLVPLRASALISDSTREHRMIFESSPVRDILHVQLQNQSLLENHKVQLPEDRFIVSEFGMYALYFEWQGNSIIVRRSVLIPEQTIAPDDFLRFADFCRTIDQYDEQELYLEGI
jgi:tetratricopeptide (TPR) repeat protein